MFDMDLTSSCRICLEEGAIYPIFESNDEFEGVYEKLAACIKEKLENIEGYPRNICIKCKNTLETLTKFIIRIEETHKVLETHLRKVKSEILEPDLLSDNDDNEEEPFFYELQIEEPNIKLQVEIPKTEKKDPTELLESLEHLTVKRIKIENDFEETASIQVEDNTKIKRGRTKKKLSTPSNNLTKKSTIAKKAVSRTSAAKKAVAKPSPVKKVKECKISDNHSQETAKGVNRANAKRMVNSDKESKETKPIINPALCHVCGESFDAKELLQQHIIRLHTERQFKCSKCPKAYHTQKHLSEHLNGHENIRNYVCDTCGKGFYNKKVLNEHIRYVHNKIRPKRTSYKCKYCDRVYMYKRGVVIHERSVHTGERPEVCNVCDGRFYDIVYLREHMRIHTGDAPFKCPVCDRGYTQRGNMKSHMRNHRISKLAPDVLAKIKPNHLKFMRP